MKVYVNYNDKRWKKYAIDFEKIACAAAPDKHDAEVSIILTDDTEIHKLNKQYRNIDKPTNVLSFELGDPILLGDIYISLDTVMRQARDANISVAEHAAHMIVHGVLHLQGYDHLTDEQAQVMEALEIKILNKLGYKNPYADENKKFGFLKYIAMAVCGGISAFGFAPFYQWWATILGVACAYWMMTGLQLTKRQRFFMGAIFGAMYSIAMFWWTLSSIYVVPELAAQFAIWTIPGIIGLGIAGAIIFGIPFIIIRAGCTKPAHRAILFACTWTIILWLREWMLTGFPWNPIANITIPLPMLANSMSLWGALGLTFIIVGFMASCVELIRNRRSLSCQITFAIFVILLSIGFFAGHQNIVRAGNTNNMSPIIKIVQPAQTQSQKMAASRSDAIAIAKENIQNLISLSNMDTMDAQLVVFPETSYPFVITDGDTMPLAQSLHTDIIIGATSYNNSRLYNSMVFADKNGKITDLYSKSHLVPFGEYRPLGVLPAPVNLARGVGRTVIDVNGFRIAPAICYEIIFSDSLVPYNTGVDAIINITNDTWFGKTPGTYQHLDMVRRYAIESGLPIIRANYSGVSAFILSDGKITTSLQVGMPGTITDTVWGAHKTPYRIIGRNGMMIIILIFACMTIFALRTTEKE